VVCVLAWAAGAWELVCVNSLQGYGLTTICSGVKILCQAPDRDEQEDEEQQNCYVTVYDHFQPG
jgi:hypothetical protein